MIIAKVILIIMVAGYNKGGVDHIEFKTMQQCQEFKAQLDKSKWERFNIECKCIEVKE